MEVVFVWLVLIKSIALVRHNNIDLSAELILHRPDVGQVHVKVLCALETVQLDGLSGLCQIIGAIVDSVNLDSAQPLRKHAKNTFSTASIKKGFSRNEMTEPLHQENAHKRMMYPDEI